MRFLCLLSVQEKLDAVNERMDQAAMGGAACKEEVPDSLDGMQAWKQSVKKCRLLLY